MTREELENEIIDLVNHRDDFTTSDLQGIISATVGRFIAENEQIVKRLKEIKQAIENENVSYGELAELVELKDYIGNDIVLKEWAGIPEK